MALWKRKSKDNQPAQQVASTPTLQIPQRQQHAPVDAVLTVPVPGHNDFT